MGDGGSGGWRSCGTTAMRTTDTTGDAGRGDGVGDDHEDVVVADVLPASDDADDADDSIDADSGDDSGGRGAGRMSNAAPRTGTGDEASA